MYIDLTVKTNPSEQKRAPYGHVGTHFDCMEKDFDLDCFCLEAFVFHISDLEIDVDVPDEVQGKFVLFDTGWEKAHGYGSSDYHKNHPQLEQHLIQTLLEKDVRLIGIDAPGIRRGKEHTPADQLCADHGVFVIENLTNLDQVKTGDLIYTAPVHFAGQTGLPCRVIAQSR